MMSSHEPAAAVRAAAAARAVAAARAAAAVMAAAAARTDAALAMPVEEQRGESGENSDVRYEI